MQCFKNTRNSTSHISSLGWLNYKDFEYFATEHWKFPYRSPLLFPLFSSQIDDCTHSKRKGIHVCLSWIAIEFLLCVTTLPISLLCKSIYILSQEISMRISKGCKLILIAKYIFADRNNLIANNHAPFKSTTATGDRSRWAVQTILCRRITKIDQILPSPPRIPSSNHPDFFRDNFFVFPQIDHLMCPDLLLKTRPSQKKPYGSF